MTIKTAEELPVAKRRVFLRVDFNVPLGPNGEILDDTRIRESLPTIQYLLEKKAAVILASHLGRPKGKADPRFSLVGVGERLSELTGQEVLFPEDAAGDAARKLTHDLREGQLLLLENLRFHAEEEANEPNFAKLLASYAEVYLSDAFGAMHRAHASTEGMVQHFKERGIGFLVKKELTFLTPLLERPQRPFIAVLGGAKVSDKLGLIENLLGRVDRILLGGGMAYTFLKARGVAVGGSLLDEERLYAAQKILARARERQTVLEIPEDHVVAESPDAPAGEVVTRIPEGKMGLDIGPATVKRYCDLLKGAKTIFWNGPMGVFEKEPFASGTRALAMAIAGTGATTVVGGGESVTALRRAGVAEKITHLSTGGGATLKFLEAGTLPGLKVLES